MSDPVDRARRVGIWPTAAVAAPADDLALSVERLRLAQEAAGVGVFDWDLTTESLQWSDETKAAFGLPASADITYARFRALVAEDDHPALDAAVAAALDPAGDGRFASVYRVMRPGGEIGWIDARGRVSFVHDELGPRPHRFVGVVLDVTDRHRTEVKLAESEARLRTLIEAIPQMVWSARPDGFHDYFNARWYQFTGVTEGSTEGEGWRGLFHPDDQATITARWSQSLATGEPYGIEYRLRHRSGEYRWVLGRALPVRDDSGRIVQWFGTCTDIDELKRAQEHRQMLLDELSHRVKNTLTIVQGIAHQTIRAGATGPDAYKAFEGRLRALAAANEVLVRDDWRAADLTTLVDDARRTSGVSADRWRAHGPSLMLAPKQAVAVALALHELSTNAMKYGALSGAEGQVAVEWSAAGHGFRLVWAESGGPPVSPPGRTGFGARLLQRALAAELGGTVRIDYRPTGVVCVIEGGRVDPQATAA